MLDALGVDRSRGVLRLSLAHYNTIDEVEQVASALAGVVG